MCTERRSLFDIPIEEILSRGSTPKGLITQSNFFAVQIELLRSRFVSHGGVVMIVSSVL